MQRHEQTARRAIRLADRVRLGALLRPHGERLFGRPHPQPYAEEEVRDRIYGWHSGTVEPPQPVGSRGGDEPAERPAAHDAS